MGELQVALYETQKNYSKLDTAPTNTTLSNDCLDNEDVILSCCAGLVREKPHPMYTIDNSQSEGYMIVNFFRMSFSSQKQDPQYTDHYLRQRPQIVQFRNTSSAFMATERDSYERTIWPSHVFNITALTRRTATASAASATTRSTGFLTVVCVTPGIPKRLPNIYRK
jgi:hypothetical protein